MATVGQIVTFLKQFAPLHLAAEWDNVGLLLGDEAAPVQRLMTCLTVTPESAAEAIAEAAQLIVAHHPILFRGAKRLTCGTPEGRLVLDLVRAGVAVYSPHTAFDNCAGGINDILARRLELTGVVPLKRHEGPAQCKIVVFVPDNDLSKVSEALFAAGAGVIGQYSQCSFRLEGTGTFFGSDASNPTVGQKGRREDIKEWRLEVVCPVEQVNTAIVALRRAHSYEEPAFDVYPLRAFPGNSGEGRLGSWAQPRPLGEVAQLVHKITGARTVQTVGIATKDVQKVAVVCGAGGEFLRTAEKAGADAFLTGEMRFHDCLAAQAAGVAVLLPGHYATERPGVEELAELLGRQFGEVRSWASRHESDPLA